MVKVLKEQPGYFAWMLNGEFPLYTKKILTEIRLRTAGLVKCPGKEYFRIINYIPVSQRRDSCIARSLGNRNLYSPISPPTPVRSSLYVALRKPLFQYGYAFTCGDVTRCYSDGSRKIEKKYILNDKVFLDMNRRGKLYHFIPVYESD